MSNHDLSRTSASRLAGIMNMADPTGSAWSAADLPAIWKHQLAAELSVELFSEDPQRQSLLRGLRRAKNERIATFANLLHHDHPPLELLDACRRYAKASLTGEQALPEEIAYALYYLAISAARVKLNQSISTLSDDDLREGLAHVLTWPWLDERSRALLSEALGQL